MLIVIFDMNGGNGDGEKAETYIETEREKGDIPIRQNMN
jgi:hypothetical protein